MKKTIKSTLKRYLCVMMALLMIMTSWVFVAPMKAEAATAGSYTVKVVLNVSDDWSNGGSNAKCTVYYGTNNGTDGKVTTNMQDKWAAEGDYNKGTNVDYTAFEATLPGFPVEVDLWYKVAWMRSVGVNNIRIYVNGVSIAHSYTGQSISVGNATKEFAITPNSSAYPTPTNITPPADETIYLNKASGSVTKTLSNCGIVKDQYGVSWYQPPTYSTGTAPGVSVVNDGDYPKVTADTAAFVTANGYNSSTGKATITLTSSLGNASATSKVYIQSPYYYVYFYGSDAFSPFSTKSCYYGGSVTPPATNPTKARDDSYHYTFDGWDINSEDDYKNITADKNINAKFVATKHTYEGAYRDNGNGTHSRQCTGCDAYGFQGVYEGSESCAAYTTYSTDGSGNHAGSCSKCSHAFSHTPNWVEVADSQYIAHVQDCTTPATYYKSCSICGIASTETFTVGDPTGHDYAKANQVKPHTCTENGTYAFYCNNCGAYKESAYMLNADGTATTEVLDPAAHTYVSVSQKDDSQHGYLCTVCGLEWSGLEAHTWTQGDKVSEPSCVTKTNAMYHYTCWCGAALDSDKAIDENGHFTEDVVEPWAHTMDGAVTKIDENTHAVTCSVCGETGTPEAHTWTDVEGTYVAPTCSSKGSQGQECQLCGATRTVEIAIDPDAHDYDETAFVDFGDGTHGYVCQYDNTHHTAVAAHNWVNDGEPTKLPTCKEVGKQPMKCSDCTATKVEDIAIDPDAHNMGGAVSNNDGTHTATCSYCGQTVKKDCVDTDDNCVCDICSYNIPHVYDREVVAEQYLKSVATCKAYAVYYKSCKCGLSSQGTASEATFEDIAGGYADHVWTNVADASLMKWDQSCEKGAIYYQQCSVCSKSSLQVEGANTALLWEDGTGLGHDYSGAIVSWNNGTHSYQCVRYTTIGNVPGCKTTGVGTNKGATEDCAPTGDYTKTDTQHIKYCACGYAFPENHTWSAWASDDAANTSAPGTHSRYCTTEGCGYEVKTVACNYTQTADVASTCVTQGYTEYKCSDCAHTYRVYKELDPGAHTGNNHNDEATAYPATCNAEGYAGDLICECGGNVGRGNIIPIDPSNHGTNPTRVEGYIEGTCVIEGHSGKTVCEGCGATLVADTITGKNPDNHKSLSDFRGTEPTCEEDGYAEYAVCGDCNKVLEGGVLTRLGHDYSGDPVANGDGTHSYECVNGCGTVGVGKIKNKTENCYGGTATCQNKAVCDVCGHEYGDLAPHSFEGEYKQVIVDGKEYHNRKCVNCDAYGIGTTEGDMIACTGGTATCLDKADCKFCGEPYGSPLGHNFTPANARINQVKDADGNPTGYHNYKCIRCDVYGIMAEDGTQTIDGSIPCFDAYPSITKPTCTQDGYVTHTCDTCLYEWVSAGDSALGHDYSEKIKDSAHLKTPGTCTTNAEYWFDCSRCSANAKNETDTDKYSNLYYVVVGAGAHNFDGNDEFKYKATDATCTQDETYYVYCSFCGVTSEGTAFEDTYRKPGSSLSHDWKEKVEDEYLKSAATCTEAAVYYKSCARCGDKSAETFVYGLALGHEYTEKIQDLAHRKNKANCQQPAAYYYDCIRCSNNAKLLGGEEAEAYVYSVGEVNPDNHVETTIIPAVSATCETAGHSAYKVCTGCKAEISKTIYPALGHNFKGAYRFDAEKDTHNRKCTRCDAYGLIVTEDGVKVNKVDATAPCTLNDWKSNGDGTHTATCVCGNSDTKACHGGEPDYDEQAICDDCGGKYGEVRVCEHTTWGDSEHYYLAQAGTCTTPAKYYKYCAQCKKSVKDIKGLANLTEDDYFTTSITGHKFVEKADSKYLVTEATCVDKATYYKSCLVCGLSVLEVKGEDGLEEGDIFAYGSFNSGNHKGDFKTEGLKDATCTANGYSGDEICLACNKIATIGHTIKKVPHTESDWIIDQGASGDCTVGIKYYIKCTVCGNIIKTKTEPADHKWITLVEVQPNCLDAGYREEMCRVCEYTRVITDDEDSSLKALGHSFTVWHDVFDATCCNGTIQQSNCDHCGKIKTRELPGTMLPHTFEVKPGQAETCQQPGYTDYYKCTVCGTIEGRTEIAPHEHPDADKDGKCDECGSLIYNSENDACGCICHKENGLMKILYKFVLFFWKLFKIGKTCECGAVHY
ncbi:MAG: hypothetical protein ACI4GB_08735 [Acutalibacteraceae bacterium]